MKQDKGRGVVIMDNHEYTEKSSEMLNTKQFSKISVDLRKRHRQRSIEFYEKSKANLRSRNTIVYTLQVLVLENFMLPLRYPK